MLSRRPSPSMVISLVALFVALGGTSYAALTITGKNVRNSSLTGADLKNNSVHGRDLRNNSVRSGDIRNGSLLRRDFRAGQLSNLAGPAGPAGPKGDTGATGATGATGPRGPSDGVSKFRATQVDVGNVLKDVHTMNLPAGTWLVTMGTNLNNNDGSQQDGECLLTIGGVTVAQSDVFRLGADTTLDREVVTLTGGRTLAAASTAVLRCSIEGASATDNGNALDPFGTAVQVETLDVQ